MKTKNKNYYKYKKLEDNLYKQQIHKLTNDLEKLKHKINKKSTNMIS